MTGRVFLFGRTALGLPILAYHFSVDSHPTPTQILILGGVHGDEKEGVYCASALLRDLLLFSNSITSLSKLDLDQTTFNGEESKASDKILPQQGKKEIFLNQLSKDIVIIPEFNPEGVLLQQRWNSNGVDLNRNLPTNDWTQQELNPRYPPGPFANSELENQSLVQWINDHSVHFILSLHSWHPLLNVNGSCLETAQIISQRTGYKVEESIGYPTPGCLGTYAAFDKSIPTLTYELERGMAWKDIDQIHVPAIWEALGSIRS